MSSSEEVDKIKEQVQSQRPDLGKEDWEKVRSSVHPLFKPDRAFHEVNSSMLQSGSPMARESLLVGTQWLADLHVVYGLDDRRTFRQINQGDLSRWGISLTELHAVAMENLNKLPPPMIPKIVVDGKVIPSMSNVKAIQGAASSYLLRSDLLERASFLGEKLIALIPDRDALVLFTDSSERREQLASRVRHDFQTMAERPISDQLFLVTRDGVSHIGSP